MSDDGNAWRLMCDFAWVIPGKAGKAALPFTRTSLMFHRLYSGTSSVGSTENRSTRNPHRVSMPHSALHTGLTGKHS